MRALTTFVLGVFFLSVSGMALNSPPVELTEQLPRNDAADNQTPKEEKIEENQESTVASDGLILKSGTEVKLVFAQSLSSKHATMGEKVDLRVAEDVIVDGQIAVPVGARVIGTVVRGKKDEKRGNSKELAVRIDCIVARDKRIKLTGERQQKSKTNIGSATAATIGLGISGLMIYMNQREAWIREGTPAIGYVEEDVVFIKQEP